MIENSSFDQEEGRYLHWRQLHKPNYINTRECIQKNWAQGPDRRAAKSHFRSWDRRVTELTPPTPTQGKVDSPTPPMRAKMASKEERIFVDYSHLSTNFKSSDKHDSSDSDSLPELVDENDPRTIQYFKEKKRFQEFQAKEQKYLLMQVQNIATK